MRKELKNKIFSFNKYISNQTEDEIMQEYWIDIKQVIENQQLELEKKDRTIQQLKDENKTLNRQAQQYFETTIIQSQQYDKETTKKDKIIDEMAISLYGYANLEVVINCPAEYDENYDLSKCRMNLADRNCINCIKQYFEKKAEGK